jgi:hypothetical protein
MSHLPTMNDSDLDDILRNSRPNLPIPASFHREVWNRIEHDALGGKPHSIANVLLALRRPWMAATGLTAALAMGAGIGFVTTPAPKVSRAAYAESISPFLQELK